MLDNDQLCDANRQVRRTPIQTSDSPSLSLVEAKNFAVATTDHADILDALRAGDLAAACAGLRQNMRSGKAPILEWLRARDAVKGAKR